MVSTMEKSRGKRGRGESDGELQFYVEWLSLRRRLSKRSEGGEGTSD